MSRIAAVVAAVEVEFIERNLSRSSTHGIIAAPVSKTSPGLLVNPTFLTLLTSLTLIASCRSSVPSGVTGDGGPPDSAVDRRPPRQDAICPADAMGGGECPINFCGTLKRPSALPMNQVPQSGADAICNQGRFLRGRPGAAEQRGLPARAQAPAGTASFGAACRPTGGGGQCAAESLCVTAPTAQPFCSKLCRNDQDCPLDAQGSPPAASTSSPGSCPTDRARSSGCASPTTSSARRASARVHGRREGACSTRAAPACASAA